MKPFSHYHENLDLELRNWHLHPIYSLEKKGRTKQTYVAALQEK